MSGKDIALRGGAAPEATDVAAGAMAQAEATVKAQLIHAMGNERDENKAYLALKGSCGRVTFAAKARYAYPRGDKEIDGLSVGFAREAARVWGNMRYGYYVASERNAQQAPPHGQVVVRGYAWDIQTNVMVEKDAVFPYLIYRKGRGWIEPDERDKRELVARHAAIAYRNCILDLIPPDVKEELLDMLRKTSQKKAAADLKADKKGTIQKLLKAFGALGVTETMLCNYLEIDHIDALKASGLSQLRAAYGSIQSGEAAASDIFPELGGQAAARGDQSVHAAEAEAELDEAEEEEYEEGEWEEEDEDEEEEEYEYEDDDEEEEADEEEEDWEEDEEEDEEPEEEDEEEPEPPKAAPKKRKRSSKGKAASAKPEGPEIRVADGQWVGDLPKVSDLPAVLDAVPEEVVVDLYEKDSRQSALQHYYKKLEELGYEVEG